MKKNDLEKLREKIDKVDQKLLKLLAQRVALVRKVGEYKKANGLKIVDSKREAEVIKQKSALVKDTVLSEDFINKVWKLFFMESYKQEK